MNICRTNKTTSKRRLKTYLSAVLFALGLTSTASAFSVSNTDLWNYDNGVTITGHSGICCSTQISNMFGNASGSGESGIGNTLFSDFQATGTVHSVTWETATQITLRSFILNAYHDDIGGAAARGFSEFRLFAFNTGTSNFDQIFSYQPGNPYGNSTNPVNGVVEDVIGTNPTHYDWNLSLAVNIDPIIASIFRAEFVQAGAPTGNTSGTRIVELDGFDTFLSSAPLPSAVPVPAALPLFGTGLALMGILGWRRKRRAA